MNKNTIDVALCAKMFLAGARTLESKKEWINELNVFPVPDGDTGTNMTLTIMSAVKEVSALEPLTMESFAKAVSSGSLRGARGNSGVILSQLLRGFTKVIRTEEEITPVVLTAAFQKAVETAYKAVMKPKEGTILTVARLGSERASELLEENPDIELDELMTAVLARCEEALEQTPELLPVLKEAGVVDSGGQGLVQVLKGALDAFHGIEIPEEAVETDEAGSVEVLRYTYCTEVVISPEKEGSDLSGNAQSLQTWLESIGDSIDVSAEGGSVRVHIHTDDPGAVLSRALALGDLTDIRIVNLRKESAEARMQDGKKSSDHPEAGNHTHTDGRSETASKTMDAQGDAASASASGDAAQTGQTASGIAAGADADASAAGEWKETGFISVSIGDGIADVFRDLGVDCLIEGGQTMNPSTEDMLNAINQVHAKNIFILPNNKNIILAANQAKSLTSDKNIFVIPTKTVPQGITAVINYVPEKSPEENAQVMEQEIETVKTGQITYAVRDTHIEDKVISAGDIMGVGDHSILAVGKDIDEVAVETVAAMMSDEAELISIYYGEDMREEEATSLCDQIAALHPECDVELNFGGQPIYYYIISVE
ncbi:MAG: DAK2 domain-containing protein [Lachnospiraceae bacterium]|nr:DAK2 domain-containing protein [Lachnospiraceae bacterium]